MRRLPQSPSTSSDRRGHATTLAEAGHYEATLRARRLSAATVARYLQVFAHFVEWRSGSARPADAVATFLSTHLPRCRCACPGRRSVIENRAALRLWLRVTQAVPSAPSAETPVDVELTAYDRYLHDTCGVAVQTRVRRTRHVRALLTHVFGDQPIRYHDLQPSTLTRFVMTRAQEVRPCTTGAIASDIRSYLRYLALAGVAVEGLADALPRVAQWRLASVPKHLAPSDLTRFLLAFGGAAPRRCRDHAMALCLATWGLRACEVAGLRLADVDWRAGTVTIRAAKTGRARVLPLPPALGEALVAYLHVRPATPSPHVFVRIGVMEGDAVTPSVVRSAVRGGFHRAGLPPSLTGTHCLRHTAATRLVNAGAALKDVADVLGHRSLDTTAVYAKVDLARLGQVAMPWPEVSR